MFGHDISLWKCIKCSFQLYINICHSNMRRFVRDLCLGKWIIVAWSIHCRITVFVFVRDKWKFLSLRSKCWDIIAQFAKQCEVSWLSNVSNRCINVRDYKIELSNAMHYVIISNRCVNISYNKSIHIGDYKIEINNALHNHKWDFFATSTSLASHASMLHWILIISLLASRPYSLWKTNN